MHANPVCLQRSHTFLQDPSCIRLSCHGCVLPSIFSPEAIKLVCPVYSPCSVTHVQQLAETCTGETAGSFRTSEKGNQNYRRVYFCWERPPWAENLRIFLPMNKGQCLSLQCLSAPLSLSFLPPSPHHSMPPRIFLCTHTATCTLTTQPGH